MTVIDVRFHLGLSATLLGEDSMGVTDERQNELYTMLVDEIGEVLNLNSNHRK